MVIPEYELLLVCSRTKLNTSQIERIRYLAENGDVNWGKLFKFSDLHRTTPLIYKSLQCCSELLPSAFLKKLKLDYQLNCAHNLLFLGTLLKLIKLLETHQVLVVPFKGPILTELVYGDICLRSFGDLDILISKSDLRHVMDILLQNGYKTNYDLTLESYLKLADKTHHANFVNISNGLVVEVHWEMSGRYTGVEINFQEIQPRLEKVFVGNQEVSTLGKEDLLVYLCIHGNRHRWEYLDSVCCVFELIQNSPELDWELAFKIARDIGASRILTLGIMLAERLFDLSISYDITNYLEDVSSLDVIAQEIEKEIFGRHYEQQTERYHLSGVLFHFRTLDRITDGIRYGIRKFLVPDIYDYKWFPLPSCLWPFYTFIRPLRFIFDFLGKRL